MPSAEAARSIDFPARPCLSGVMCFTQQRLSVRWHDGVVTGLSVGAGRKAMHPSLSAQTPAAGRRRRTFSHVPDVRWWQACPPGETSWSFRSASRFRGSTKSRLTVRRAMTKTANPASSSSRKKCYKFLLAFETVKSS